MVLVTVRHGTQFASLWGNWTGAASALLAAAVCWSVARRSSSFTRRGWRLVSLSLVLAFLNQFAYTYYFDYLHAPSAALWPSDILVFFWAVPAMMAFFLSPRDPSSGVRWLRVCDFVQVCTLVLALELSLLYIPSRWQSSEPVMFVRTFHVALLFFGVLALAFLVRGLLTPLRTARAFFFRLAAFFFVFGVTTNTTRYAIAAGTYRQGTWLDLPWTVSYCLLAVIAATWADPGPLSPESVEPWSPTMQLLAQFSPLLIPAIVFSLVLRIAQEQFLWSAFLVTVSFAAASARLFVVQSQLLYSSQELQKNLSLLQGITEGTTDSIFVKDLQGRYLMINSAGAQLLGRTVDEVIGKNDIDLFTPDSGREIMAADRKVVESGKTQTYEELGVSAGVARTYLVDQGSASRFQWRDHRACSVFAAISLIANAPKRSFVNPSKSFAFTSNILPWRSSNGIPVFELRNGVLRQSGSSDTRATRSLAVMRASSCLPHCREHVDRMGQEILEQTGGTRSTNDNLTKDGRTISCEWYNTPLVDESGNVLGVASLVQDVTERVALEERLRQSQKMEAVGRLAGGVAHDFNNLLTVIMGYSQILTDGLPGASRLIDATTQIRSAADRAAGITRQLLAFSRKQVLSPRVIDLNDIMLNLDTMLRRLIGEDVEVLTVPGRDLGAVKADPGQIEQVIMNLALNARDAMPNGGKLTLETENMDLDDAYAREHAPLQPGRYVMLAVSDTGTGMSSDTQGPHLRTFLHHQGSWQGHRPRTLHGLRNRQAEWRLHLGLQRARIRVRPSRFICPASINPRKPLPRRSGPPACNAALRPSCWSRTTTSCVN